MTLATLNFICQSASHLARLFRSSCRISQSAEERIFLYNIQFLSARNGPSSVGALDPWASEDGNGLNRIENETTENVLEDIELSEDQRFIKAS